MTGTGPSREYLERLTQECRRGRLSRRDFMRLSVVAGMSAAGATSLWSSGVAAQPSRGGTFRVGCHDGNTSDTHDPGTYVSFGTIQLAHTFRSYLTLITPTNELGPDMATAWSANEDASVWTFELNRDASFHDGRPFTAKDAAASLNHHRGDDSTSAAKALLVDVTDVRADGDHTLVVELERGVADLPWIMTDYHFAMLPANEDGTIEWQTGIGAGPYKIVSHEAGVRTQLERHDGWHLEGAYFDEVDLRMLNDPNARQTALVTREIDAVTQLELKTLALLQRDPSIAIDNVGSGNTVTIPMHCDTAPFDDVRVRNALKLAINRQDIVDKIAFGNAILGNDVHVSPNMPYYADLPQREYDPEQAKALLKEAGHESLNVSLSTADTVYSGAVDMAVLYSEHAKAAGININVSREPNDGYYSDVWLKKPFCMVQWGARPTPDNMFSLAYKDDAAWNESKWQNERFNELLLQAKSELDEGLRAEMYREMQQIAHDDGGTVIPMFTNFVYARRDNVQHGENLSAAWQLDGARGTSRWWFSG